MALTSILTAAMSITGPRAAAQGMESEARHGSSTHKGTHHGTYQLAAQLPTRIRKGVTTSLVLYVQKSDWPVDDVAACLVPAPFFTSEEDATDLTPAIGIDLGAGTEPGSQSGCVGAIAAVRTAPGVYQFTWEPDTAGRVNLRFTAGDSQLNEAVNVSSAPPNAALLIAFALLVAAILAAAHRMRRSQQRQGDLT